MLDPLPPGTHALHLAAGVDLDGDGVPDFSVELDHELTVAP